MKQHRNVYLWYVTTFFTSAAFTLPIWVIFNTEILQLNYTEAFILGMAAYGFSAIFEIPTGSWADKYGRVKIFRGGLILSTIAIASYIFFTGFWLLLMFQILGALGTSMMSGTLQALVHDSVRGRDNEHYYAKIRSRRQAILFISRVATVVFGGLLYAIEPHLPFIFTVIFCMVGIGVSMFFCEVRLEKMAENTHFKHVVETLKRMTRKKKLVALFCLYMMFALVAEGLFSMYQPYFKSIGVQIGEFGIFYAVVSLLSAVGSLNIARLMKRFNAFRIFLFMLLAAIFTLLLMLFNNQMLVFVAIIPSSIAFGFMVPLMDTSVQKEISSSHQAAALSVFGVIETLAILAATLPVGVALDFISPQTLNLILLSMGIVFLVPFGVVLRCRK